MSAASAQEPSDGNVRQLQFISGGGTFAGMSAATRDIYGLPQDSDGYLFTEGSTGTVRLALDGMVETTLTVTLRQRSFDNPANRDADYVLVNDAGVRLGTTATSVELRIPPATTNVPVEIFLPHHSDMRYDSVKILTLEIGDITSTVAPRPSVRAGAASSTTIFIVDADQVRVRYRASLYQYIENTQASPAFFIQSENVGAVRASEPAVEVASFPDYGEASPYIVRSIALRDRQRRVLYTATYTTRGVAGVTMPTTETVPVAWRSFARAITEPGLAISVPETRNGRLLAGVTSSVENIGTSTYSPLRNTILVIYVTPIDDQVAVEDNEAVVVRVLPNGDDPRVARGGTTELIILDDDLALVGFRTSTFTVAEGATAVVEWRSSSVVARPVEARAVATDVAGQVTTFTSVMQRLASTGAFIITTDEDNVSTANRLISLRFSLLTSHDGLRLRSGMATAVLEIVDNDPVTIGFEQAVYSADEGETIEVCATIGPPELAIDRNFSLSVTATAVSAGDSEFTLDGAALDSFDGANRRRCLNVTITDDAQAEAREEFMLELSPQTLPNAVFSTTRTRVQILANDWPVTIAGPEAPVREGRTALFTVARAGSSSEPTTVLYRVTTATGVTTVTADDFPAYETLPGTGSVVIAPGTSETATFGVRIGADLSVEDAETFQVELTGAGVMAIARPSTATATIATSSATLRRFVIADMPEAITEGAARDYVIRLEAASSQSASLATLSTDVAVHWTLLPDGGGASAMDFEAATGTVAFESGAAAGATRTFTAAPRADGLNEGDERFLLELDAPGDATAVVGAEVAVTIVDAADDTLFIELVGGDPALISEGGAGATLRFRTSRATPTAALILPYEVTNPSARLASSEYGLANGRGVRVMSTAVVVDVAAAGGSTPSFSVRAAEDNENEGVETATFRFIAERFRSAGAVSATADVAFEMRIAANDPTTYTVSGPAAPVLEGSDAVFTVRATGGLLTEPATLEWNVVGRAPMAAMPADDLALGALSRTLTFAAQGEISTEVRIPVRSDGAAEATETFTLTLDNPLGGRPGGGGVFVGEPSSAHAVIAENDQPVTIAGPNTVREDAGSVTFTISRGGVTPAPTTVTWQVSAVSAALTSADLFTISLPLTGEALLPAGANVTQTFSVPVFDDAMAEEAETFRVALTDGGAAALGEPSSLTVTIPRNDQPFVAMVAAASPRVAESATATFEIRLLAIASGMPMAPPSPVTLEYELSGSAAGGRDYRYPQGYDEGAGVGTATLDGVGTDVIALRLFDDALNEGDKDIAIRLLRVTTGALLTNLAENPSSRSASIIVADDDPLTVALSAPPSPVAEGATATFIVSLGSTPTRAVGMPYSISTATTTTLPRVDADDFNAPFPQTGILRFAAGEYSTRVSVGIRLDVLAEGREYFEMAVTATAITGAYGAAPTSDVRAEASISTSPVVLVAIEGPAQAATEGGAAAFTVSRNVAWPYPTTVTYRITSQSRSLGAGDLDAYERLPATGSVTVAASEVSATLAIEIFDDGFAEDEERFRVALIGLSGPGFESAARSLARSSSATAVIGANDRIAIGFEQDSYAVRRGEQQTACVVAPPSAMTEEEFFLSLSTVAGSAVAGGDFEALTEVPLGPFRTGGTRHCVTVRTIGGVLTGARELSLALSKPPSLQRVALGNARATIVISSIDLEPPRFEYDAVAYASGQSRLWLQLDEPVKVLVDGSTRTPATTPSLGAETTLTGFSVFAAPPLTNDACALGVQDASAVISGTRAYYSPLVEAVVLELSRPTAAGDDLWVGYCYEDGAGIYDQAVERGFADAAVGRNQLRRQLGRMRLDLTQDRDGDGVPDVAEARLGGDPLSAGAPDDVPTVQVTRGVAGAVAHVAYSMIRALGARRHLGVEVTGAAVTVRAYYLSNTFGYTGDDAASYGCDGQFSSNYAMPLSAGGCATVDFANIPADVDHVIGWFALGASGYWYTTATAGATAGAPRGLPRQTIRRVPEVNMAARRVYLADMGKEAALRASRDAAAPVSGLRLVVTTDTTTSRLDVALPLSSPMARTFAGAVAATGSYVIRGLDTGAGTPDLLWRVGDDLGALDAGSYSLGRVTQTQVSLLPDAALSLGAAELTRGGAAQSALRAGESGYALRITARAPAAADVTLEEPNRALTGTVALRLDAAASVIRSAPSFGIASDATTRTLVFAVTLASGDERLRREYGWPILRAQDADGDGIGDAVDDFNRAGVLPVVVGGGALGHMRPASPLYSLRIGTGARERALERTRGAQGGASPGYGDYAASSFDDPRYRVVYDFEIYGVDEDAITDDGVMGGVAGVIIPLPSSLHVVAGLTLFKLPSGREFDASGANDYGFADLDENGACPDDTGERYRKAGDGRIEKRSGEACIVAYIVDGGGNDEDGEINGIVSDPLGVGAGGSSSGGSGGGFGVAGLLLLLLLAMAISPRLFSHRRGTILKSFCPW